jgi:hypothetical protein
MIPIALGTLAVATGAAACAGFFLDTDFFDTGFFEAADFVRAAVFLRAAGRAAFREAFLRAGMTFLLERFALTNRNRTPGTAESAPAHFNR